MYIAIFKSQEYRFSTIEETAMFLYKRTKQEALNGNIELDFQVFFFENGVYKELNKTETASFNRYAMDLWEQNATEEQVELLNKYKNNIEAREIKLKEIEEKRKNNAN